MADQNNNGRYEPFKATVLWKSMQKCFRDTVPRANKQLRNKKLSDCFTGADAVETLSHFLTKNREEFGMREITTDKIVKLCHCWLESGVFEPMGSSSERLNMSSKPLAFVNSPNVLYRFCEETDSVRVTQLFQSPSVSQPGRFRTVSSSAQIEIFKKKKWNLTPETARTKACKAGILDVPWQERKKEPGNSPLSRKKTFLSPVLGRSNKVGGSDQSPNRKAFSASSPNSGDVYMTSPAEKDKSAKKSEIRTGKFALLNGGRSPKFNVVVTEQEEKIDSEKERRLVRSESDYFSEILDSNMSLASATSFNDSDLDILDYEKVDDMLVHDLALFRLLTLVDIPVLDGILHVKNRVVDLSQIGGGVIENLMAKMNISSSAVFSKPSSAEYSDGTEPEVMSTGDPWFISGMACIPENLRQNVWEELGSIARIRHFAGQKVFLFHKVCEVYNKLRSKDISLIPIHYEDLVTAILNQHIQRKKLVSSLESCQLLFFMLPKETRDVLRRLLRFMEAAWNDLESEISPKGSNLDTCMQTFCPVIIKCGYLEEMSVWEFVQFLVKNVNFFSDFPVELKRSIYQQVMSRNSTEAGPGLTYCERITKTEFELQKMEKSEEALVALANAVIEDIKMSYPEKAKYLSKFKSNYPELYNTHFSDVFW